MTRLSARTILLAVMLVMALVVMACDSTAPARQPETSPVTAPTIEVATPVATPDPTPAPAATPTPAPAATPTPTPEATPPPFLGQFTGVPGIVDPTNLGWPRQVEGLNGIVEIPAKPQRIITASIGHDEMALAIAPASRLVGVGAVSKNVTYSNIASLVQDKPEITRDPETIIAQSPDVIVTSPFFSEDGIEALSNVGIPVIQTRLDHDAEARLDNILLFGYILGEEARALEFAQEVRERLNAVLSVTAAQQDKPRVLSLTSYSDNLWVAGANSTEGSVTEAAGGVNAAAEQGVTGNQTTSLEGVIAMNPDVIIIPQPVEFGAEEFRDRLLSEEALQEVPAIRDGRVSVVESKHFTTLSYWNIRGVESLARMLWPDEFSEPAPGGFSTAG